MSHANAARRLAHEVANLFLRDFTLLEPLPGEDDLRARTLRRLLSLLDGVVRGVLEVHRLVHGLHAVVEGEHLVRGEGHGDAVEEVFTESALLGVESRDEQGFARVPEGDTLALHHVLTLGEHGQEEVGHGLVEEVDLVDVEDAAVRLGEEAGLEHRLALLHRSLDVDGSHQAILGDAEGNLDEWGLTDAGHDVTLGVARELLAEPIFPRVGIFRVGVAEGAVDHLDGGQERVETAGHDGLGGTAPAGDGDTAEVRVDGAEQKRGLDVLLADDRGEGVRLTDPGGFDLSVPISLHLRSLGDSGGDDVGVGHGGANDGPGRLHHASGARAEGGGAGSLRLGAARCGNDRGWEEEYGQLQHTNTVARLRRGRGDEVRGRVVRVDD